ncbi:MAG: EamA family transporter RarD [Chloroflexi bacterium]|nr:EamA family transporter RarD [Chloroflexota bacterium]MBI3340880.1 EamA family transporter RarD [Chloroflexota bacterium]
MKKGILYAVGAYLMWGLFPLYWIQLETIPALQLIGHRIAWSFILLIIVIFIARQWKDFRAALNAKTIRIYLIAAVLISVNWFTYVWAVNNGFVVETSLGYYINPLFSVLLGVIVFRERLRPIQWIPIALAAAGVFYLTATYGSLPWIALTLAFTFGLYGLVKKTAPLSSLYGLTLETGLLFLVAVAYLLYSEFTGQGAFLRSGPKADLMMVGAGLVTTVPLLLFAYAAQRVPLTTLGILQYINPTMQFLLGVLLYKEPFTQNRLIGFGMVWAGLILFWIEGLYARRNISPEPVPEIGEG